MSHSQLDGKVVLVTGAAKRIGRGIALRLAQEGARVAIHYFESEDGGAADGRGVRRRRRCSAPIWRASPQIERMFARGRRSAWAGSTALVNNAARFTRFDPLEITEKDWDFIHSVNLKAVFFCCQQGARLMRQSGRRPDRQHQFARRDPALGGARALLRVEGRRDHADQGAGQGICPDDHGELRRSRRDPVRRYRRTRQAA